MKWTLYHIKGIKWGCTNRLKSRLREQGYTLNDVSQTMEFDNIQIASEWEKDLNIRDGYGWNDSQNYIRVYEAGRKRGPFKKEEYVSGGVTTGNLMKESGQIQKLGSEWGKINGLKRAHKVKAYREGIEVGVWESLTQCAKALRTDRASIKGVIDGKYKQAKGYTFGYA